jgi:tape measure domain-containing protein
MAAETFRIEIPIDVEDNTEPGVSSAKRKVKSFDDVNRKTQERLDKMNRTKYRVVLDALDRASSVIGAVRSKVGGFAGRTFSFTLKVLDVATAPLRGVLNLVTSIQGAVLGATGAFAGIYQPMNLAGDYEQTVVAFNTLLGSAEKATKFLKEAQQFANTTPFEFPELLDSSKLLLAFGFQADNILDMMETIGDTSSGLGAGAEGIDRITRALGQMYAKGRVQAEELLQLQEMGVPAAEILQQELGLTAEQVANIGNESVNASVAIQALLTGMDKRFGGMMANQSKTAKGMISTIKDTVQNNLIRNWGEGLWEGVKPGLEKVTTWLDENQDTVAEWGEAWKEAGANISKWVMDRIDGLRKTVSDLVNSQEWKDAESFGEKVSLAWDKIIAEPFDAWWNSTGKAWLSEKAASIGHGLGSAITTGLLGLLGIDVSDALADGKTVGSSFIDGFAQGFDTEKITAALKTWADENKEIVAAIGIGIGAKMLGGIITGLGKLAELKNLFGGKGSKATEAAGASGGSRYTTTTMNVTASVVNVYGNSIGNRTSTAANVAGASGSSLPVLAGAGAGGVGRALIGGAPLALPGRQLALPGEVVTTAAGGGKAAWLAQAPGGVIGSLLAKAGVALGSGASTAAGAAAAGAASIGSGILGGIGIIDGIRNIIRGTQTSGKSAQDEYAKGGTKIGMIGAGAGIGAAVGSVVPVVGTGVGALVGAGVGGIGALLGGDSIGEALSDALDEGGWINNMGDAVGTFFSETLPEKWGEFWDGVGDFFTETIPYGLGFATGKVQTFFTETLPSKWTEFWNGVGNFFTESVPAWWENVKAGATTFFTVTIPAKWTEFWDGVGNFFTETIPTWWEGVKTGATEFFTVTIPNKWTDFWDGVGNFFTESIPTWWGNLTSKVSEFFTVTIPNAWNGFWDGLWSNVSGFFGGVWDKVTGAFGSGYSDATEHAWGGIMTKPHMGIVAEDGAESIIPLSPSKRSRGIDLWERTGQALGVRPYADGGIVGTTDEEHTVPLETGSTGGPRVDIHLEMTPQFVIEARDSGLDEEGIVAIIKARIREMVDDISDELAERLARIFANMPVKGGA